jgi:calcineurin-like phosphoesterase family protein
MHEALIKNWNACVSTDDKVYVLGDFSFGSKNKTNEIISRLNGHKILIIGNHDREVKKCNFNEKYDHLEIKVKDREVHLSHYPFIGNGDDRYESSKVLDDGSRILLHGHVHNSWKINGRQINVGCDVWGFTPISEDELYEVIKLL